MKTFSYVETLEPLPAVLGCGRNGGLVEVRIIKGKLCFGFGLGFDF
ncbi:hypothetical protein ACP4OV_017887 [Aristida adscensionis]